MPRKPKPSPLIDKKASIYIERNGLSIRIDDVAASDAGVVAFDLLQAMRLLQRTHGELVPDLGTVGGYHALSTIEDDWADDGRRRAGFKIP